jgi:short-subunit dehydrogenase
MIKYLHITVLLPGATDTPMLTASGIDPVDLPGIMKPMSPEQCVAEGLAALEANRATHIAGRMNRIMAAAMPRSLAIRLYGSMMERIIAGRSASAAGIGKEFARNKEKE